MKRTLALVGAGTLIAWTGLGFVAWSSVAQRVTVVFSDAESDAKPQRELLALSDELGALRQDVRALMNALGENLQALSEGLQASQDEHASLLVLRMDALRDEVGSLTVSPRSNELDDLLHELGTLREALRASVVPGSAVQSLLPVATPTVASALPNEAAEARAAVAASERVEASEIPRTPAFTEPQPEKSTSRKSFLAFTLPSEDFRFAELRSWTLLPALSRVGFDAQTTLHDFTATTSSLEGELEVDLAHPDVTPRAHVRARAATLESGNDERDGSMRENLTVEAHPLLEFELMGFESTAVDSAAMRVTGRARGRLSLRGVTQEVTMPVQLSIDAARRLCVEGEMALDLERFAVPVPNKLGLITMEKEVKVWISLRLRANPRTDG